MRVLELFGGAGGSALGLRSAGWASVGVVERDPHAANTLRAGGFPTLEGSVEDLDLLRDVPAPDLLWASPPCQPASTAGRRSGTDDARDGWGPTLRVLRHLRETHRGPRGFLAENVPGTLRHRTGFRCRGVQPDRCPACMFDATVLVELRTMFGWVGVRVLESAAYGVPQTRHRMVVAAGPGPFRWPDPTHGEGRLPYRTLGEALGYRGQEPHGWVPEEALLEDPNPVIYRVGVAGSEPWRLHRPSPCVAASDEKGTNAGADGIPGWQGGPPRCSDGLFLATGRRRATIWEMKRLQGIPDHHTIMGPRKAQYAQVGNAVPPLLAHHLGMAAKEWLCRN